MIYPIEFGDKDLKRLFKLFSSIQNRILIDYKKMRTFIMERIKSPTTIEPPTLAKVN